MGGPIACWLEWGGWWGSPGGLKAEWERLVGGGPDLRGSHCWKCSLLLQRSSFVLPGPHHPIIALQQTFGQWAVSQGARSFDYRDSRFSDSVMMAASYQLLVCGRSELKPERGRVSLRLCGSPVRSGLAASWVSFHRWGAWAHSVWVTSPGSQSFSGPGLRLEPWAVVWSHRV